MRFLISLLLAFSALSAAAQTYPAEPAYRQNVAWAKTKQGDQAWRQSILCIFKDARQAARKERPSERNHDTVLEQQRPH